METKDLYNIMNEGIQVKVINEQYLKDFEIVNNLFNIYALYYDGIISLININGIVYSELSVGDLMIA